MSIHFYLNCFKCKTIRTVLRPVCTEMRSSLPGCFYMLVMYRFYISTENLSVVSHSCTVTFTLKLRIFITLEFASLL